MSPLIKPHMFGACKPQMANAGCDHTFVDNKTRKALARNLRRRMEESADLRSQPAVAARSGISQTHISRMLRCTSAATVDMLEALARTFRCQAWELLVDEDQTREEALRRMLRPPQH